MGRRKTRKNRGSSINQRGGRYLGKGSYGCVFGKPALKCKGNTVRNNTKLSKLMVPEEAQKEWVQRPMLEAVDPGQTFLLFPQRTCEAEAFEPMNQIEKCSLFPYEEKRQNATGAVYVHRTIPAANGQIVEYTYGGTDLDHTNITAANRRLILESFQRLCVGLSKLHEADIFHQDIKTGNIVVDGDPPVARFIDFGLAATPAQMIELLKGHLEGRRMLNYYCWPYEYRFLGVMSMSVVPPFPAAFNPDNWTRFKAERNRASANYYRDCFPLQQDLSVPDIQKLYTDLATIPSNLDRLRVLMAVCDVYSMGIVLAILLYRSFKIRILPDRIERFTNSGYQTVSDAVAVRLAPFGTLLRAMTNLDPFQRPTAFEVATILGQILAPAPVPVPVPAPAPAPTPATTGLSLLANAAAAAPARPPWGAPSQGPAFTLPPWGAPSQGPAFTLPPWGAPSQAAATSLAGTKRKGTTNIPNATKRPNVKSPRK